MKLYSKITLSLCLALTTISTSFADNRALSRFKADSPQIDYLGRTEVIANGAVRYDWVGTQLRTRFTGDYCAIKVSDSQSNFHYVFVDGKFVKDINTKGNDTIIELCDKIGGGAHTLEIFKRTEAGEGITTISEIILSDGAKLLPYNNIKNRKIEFIGNSITCGFGTDTNNPMEEYTAETENAYRSYASITARYFDADQTLIAHSGQGVVKNYGDKKGTSDYTMRHRFFTTYDTESEKAKRWDFSKHRPDVVVINLGTNDFSTLPHPTDDQFVAGYKELVQSVRSVYGDIPILCLTATMSYQKQYDCVKRAWMELNDSKIYYVPMYHYLNNREKDLGAGCHPNREGQKKIAMVLIPYISSIMGWELTNKTIE